MSIVRDLQESIETNLDRNAFCINNQYFSYAELAKTISTIRSAIQASVNKEAINISLIANDDIETYASIIALWMEGKAYVPLNPEFPIERNHFVINQADIEVVLDSSKTQTFSDYKTISTSKLESSIINLNHKDVSEDDFAYILFTSGTTGTPKGVPITFSNLSGFIDAFWKLEYPITKEDRCLQMFELTFDLSVFSYLAPLLKGACVYTVPKNTIKYSYIYELMEDYELTFALMVPSILQYLRPYFDEINCESMKYSLFCGEALPIDVTYEWSKCIPNAVISNVYGPTECTIFCTYYKYENKKVNKSYNGILSIGKDMNTTTTIIVDNKNEEVKIGESGELCLSGIQLTKGYWENEEKNEKAFFYKKHQGKEIRFYRTGDICKIDDEGDLLYIGRVDSQVKIQGFRVELSEIEYHSKAFFNKTNIVALGFENAIKNTEIGLVLNSDIVETQSLLGYLKTKMPNYMLPTQIKFINEFPLNANGKTDRNKLKQLFID